MGFLGSQLCTVHLKHSSRSDENTFVICNQSIFNLKAFDFSLRFVSLPNKPRCFVIYWWYISYARHIMNKWHGVIADNVKVHMFHPVICFPELEIDLSLVNIIYCNTHGSLLWTEHWTRPTPVTQMAAFWLMTKGHWPILMSCCLTFNVVIFLLWRPLYFQFLSALFFHSAILSQK